MARVIVAALYNMKKLPPSDDDRVVKWARKRSVELADHHKRAIAAINSTG
jgi:hypothetical protein